MLRNILLFLFSIASGMCYSQLTVAEIFTDNMVIQRDQPIRVWGWTTANEDVYVTLGQESVSASADSEGLWKVEMPELEAGGPYELMIKSGSGIIKLGNILIGDVWLCSGQSNMEWVLANSNNAEAEIKNSDYPEIRHFKVPTSWSREKSDHLEGGPWEISSPETSGSFTAVGYFFARELQKHVDVPIGLINSSWGGSRIEPWMRMEVAGQFLEEDLDEFLAKKEAEQKAALQELEQKVSPLLTDEEIRNAHSSDYDASGWAKLKVPQLWEQSGYNGMDGIAWVRKEITLSPEEAKEDVALHLAMIDDADMTYVNGELVGQGSQWNAYREYTISSNVLKPGKNVIMVRIEDTGGGGGIHGDAGEMYYASSAGRHELAGNWQFKVEKISLRGAGMAPNQIPTLLYNKMINPIIHFPIKGALWYQGESNTGDRDAYRYRDIFKTMITDWRELWDVGDFPFLWVQLANFMAPDEQPAESNWAVLRESQSAALELPNTGEAVIIDIGEANDIHPRNKQDVGLRLSLAARKVAYGEDIVYSGPVFQSARKQGNEVILTFDHIGSGLKTMNTDGSVGGFAVAGADGNFVWATARIDGNTIRINADEVPNPAHVRYAWGNNPDKASLYNQEGLPARPFRANVK